MIINQLLMYLKNTLTPQPAITNFPIHILFMIFMALISLVSAQAFFSYYIFLILENLELFATPETVLATAGVTMIEAALFIFMTKCYIKKLATDNLVYRGYEKIRGVSEAFLNGFNSK